jgi:hypothetical protein
VKKLASLNVNYLADKWFPDGMEPERSLLPSRKVGNNLEPIKSSTDIKNRTEHRNENVNEK